MDWARTRSRKMCLALAVGERFGPLGMTNICWVFFLSSFYGMLLNNLRKPEMVRTVGKKTEAPETSLARTSFHPFTQVLNKAIHILPNFSGTLLAQYDIPYSSLTNVKAHLVGG